jgi:peptidyl-prolyl cis-trans isomerase SurA
MKQRLKFALVTCVMASLPATAMARGLRVDGYAATVNARVITLGDVVAYVQPIQMRLAESYEGEELEKKLNAAMSEQLDVLIERALILEEFALKGGTIPDRLVDDRINGMISDRFKNDRAAFLQALADERMTMEDWRDEIRNQLIVSILRRQEVSDRVLVSPRSARDSYDAQIDKFRIREQVKLRMIVLHKGSTPEDLKVKRQEAEGIRGKLIAGENFEALAKTESEGSRAAEGGDQGWIEPSSLRTELAAAATHLEAGRISDVIAAGDELYILKVEARKNASIIPFEEARAGIEKELRMAEEERLYKAWIERLKGKFHLKIFADNLIWNP